MLPPFEYRKLGDFTYHVLSDPTEIQNHLMKWILREWEADHAEAPHEHWTMEWMNLLPRLEFRLEILSLDQIQLHPDLMRVPEFLVGLQERAQEREESFLRGGSVEPLLINGDNFGLMDGYTRYTVLKKYQQRDVYAYVGRVTTA